MTIEHTDLIALRTPFLERINSLGMSIHTESTKREPDKAHLRILIAKRDGLIEEMRQTEEAAGWEPGE